MYAKSKIINIHTKLFALMDLTEEEFNQLRTSIEIQFNMINKAKQTLLLNDKDSSMLDEKIDRAKNIMATMDQLI